MAVNLKDVCCYCSGSFDAKKSGYYRYPASKIVKINNENDEDDDGSMNPSFITACTFFSLPIHANWPFVCHTCFTTVQRYGKKLNDIEALRRDLELRNDCMRLAKTQTAAKRRAVNSITPILSGLQTKRRRMQSPAHGLLPSTSCGRGGGDADVGLESPTIIPRSFKKAAKRAIDQSKFKTAFLHLIYGSQSAFTQFLTIVRRIIRQEKCETFDDETNELFSAASASTMETFSWESVLTKLATTMPTVYTAVSSVVSNKTTKIDIMRHRGSGATGLGFVLAVMLRLAKPSRCKFIQEVNSVEMWRCGCKQKLFATYLKLGVSCGVKGTRAVIDRWREEHTSEVTMLKHELETNDISSSTSSYCLCVDNIQKKSHARFQSSERHGNANLWALPFACINRVNFLDFVDDYNIKASDMAINTFLPGPDDTDKLRSRMVIITARILVKHIQYYRSETDRRDVPKHIPHQYSDEMLQPSKIINIGVIREDPSTTRGTISLLEILQDKMVPNLGDGNLLKLCCHGDGLTVERGRDARRARRGGETPWTRLEGLEVVPQEFHKRGIYLQDIMNRFFSGLSAGDCGTLFQLKNVFAHKTLKKEVMDNFNQVSNFLKFVTEGFVLLAAFELTGMQQLTDDPGIDVIQLAERIVHSVWQPIDMSDVPDAREIADEDEDDDDNEEAYCFCGGGEYLPMVQCSNPRCTNGRWFHYTCIGIGDDEEEDVDEILNDDWWCSPECAQYSIFCICNKSQPDQELIECYRGANCLKSRKYHISCIGLHGTLPADPWYCCVECLEIKASKKDHVNLYSTALLWYLLNDLARVDAVKEGDGPAMISNWRLDIGEMFNNRHNKYMIICHYLLAGLNGWWPERIGNEVMWNRTANLIGGEGRNHPLDYVNELLNGEFKENLKHVGGHYTELTLERCSQLIGRAGQLIDQVYQRNVGTTYLFHSTASRSENAYDKDIVKLAKDYRKYRLFAWIPGRQHDGFPGFKPVTKITNASKMKQRLKKYSTKLDYLKDFV